MTELCRSHIDHPGAWTGTELRTKDQVAFDLAPNQISDLDEALGRVQAKGLELEHIGRQDFVLPVLAVDISRMTRELMDGHGLIIIRGIPVERYNQADVEALYWGIGLQFGTPVSQSVMGDVMGYVTDVTDTEENVRPYRARNELRLHADFADLAGLLCVRQARSGGLSHIVSTLAVHNEMLATRPDLLEQLYRGYRYHRLGEQAEDEAHITDHRVPHYSYRDGHVSCRYSRAYILEAAHASGKPLTSLEEEALDCFDSIAYRADMRFEFQLDPGELLLVNSFTTLHSRTAFEDHDDPAQKRLLLRLWLAAYEPRPVVPGIWIYSGGRNGIPKRGTGRPAGFERVASADWNS